jgi:hypothetical protein
VSRIFAVINYIEAASSSIISHRFFLFLPIVVITDLILTWLTFTLILKFPHLEIVLLLVLVLELGIVVLVGVLVIGLTDGRTFRWMGEVKRGWLELFLDLLISLLLRVQGRIWNRRMDWGGILWEEFACSNFEAWFGLIALRLLVSSFRDILAQLELESLWM